MLIKPKWILNPDIVVIQLTCHSIVELAKKDKQIENLRALVAKNLVNEEKRSKPRNTYCEIEWVRCQFLEPTSRFNIKIIKKWHENIQSLPRSPRDSLSCPCCSSYQHIFCRSYPTPSSLFLDAKIGIIPKNRAVKLWRIIKLLRKPSK